eukprot:m.3116 g.3116  ORF g.3116 m.3116 type:complete len:505 (-) comp2676_c0_seq1:160-1674(-)
MFGQNVDKSKIIQEFSVASLAGLHEHIVSVFGIIELDDRGCCLVKQQVDGPPLAEVIENNEIDLSFEKRGEWLLQVGKGMNHLHSLRPRLILHRDLKTSNILLSTKNLKNAVAKVFNFGLSKAIEVLGTRTFTRGTLAWAAPETMNGIFSPKSDVYSFGIMIGAVMTRKMPDSGDVDLCDRSVAWKPLMEMCCCQVPDERPSFSVIVDKAKSLQHNAVVNIGAPDVPWRWPSECDELVSDSMFVNITTTAAMRCIQDMIRESGGRNNEFNLNQVQQYIAINKREMIAAHNTWIELQKLNFKVTKRGKNVSDPTHHMYVQRDTSTHSEATLQWLNTYGCNRPPSLLLQPGSTPYRSLLVYHGFTGTLAEAKHVCKTGFRVVNNRNDGWFGNGVYFTPDLDYALSYARHTDNTQHAIVIACHMALFNPYPVCDLSMKGKPIKARADAHIAVVRHANTISGNSTVPIPPSQWKCPKNPNGTPVSMEIVIDHVQALPRFIMVFPHTPP